MPTPTIQDIARELSVSKGTVSLALNDQPGVNALTRQRVKDYAQSIGYRPNTLARAFGGGRSQLVAVTLARLTDSFFEEIVQGIENVAHAEGYDVIVSTAWSRGQTANEVVERLIGRRIDGFIGGSASLPAEGRERLREAGVKQLYLGADPVADYPTIMVDNAHGATLAAEHLYEFGHRHVLFLGTQDRHSALRAAAAAQYFADQGVTMEERLIEGAHDMERTYYTVASRLRTRFDFTAVLCASDVLALGAVNAITDAGMTVPDDISVVGYDDLRWAKLVRPALTTVHQPQTSQGEAAMRALIDLIEGRPVENQVLEPRLIIRDSTAAASLK